MYRRPTPSRLVCAVPSQGSSVTALRPRPYTRSSLTKSSWAGSPCVAHQTVATGCLPFACSTSRTGRDSKRRKRQPSQVGMVTWATSKACPAMPLLCTGVHALPTLSTTSTVVTLWGAPAPRPIPCGSHTLLRCPFVRKTRVIHRSLLGYLRAEGWKVGGEEDIGLLH